MVQEIWALLGLNARAQIPDISELSVAHIIGQLTTLPAGLGWA